jgi:hypothetical protein
MSREKTVDGYEDQFEGETAFSVSEEDSDIVRGIRGVTKRDEPDFKKTLAENRRTDAIRRFYPEFLCAAMSTIHAQRPNIYLDRREFMLFTNDLASDLLNLYLAKMEETK